VSAVWSLVWLGGLALAEPLPSAADAAAAPVPTAAAAPAAPVGAGQPPPEAPAPLAEPPALAPPDEATARALTEEVSRGLRCPVCQGLSVADSNADSARAMHTRIGELVRLGYSREQIEAYFVDRYGEWVRLAPPREGLHWLIWLGPAALLVVGAVALAARSRGAAAPPPAAAAPAPATPDAYRARFLSELDDEGR